MLQIVKKNLSASKLLPDEIVSNDMHQCAMTFWPKLTFQPEMAIWQEIAFRPEMTRIELIRYILARMALVRNCFFARYDFSATICFSA